MAFVGVSDAEVSLLQLQRNSVAKKQAGEGILEFGARVWGVWQDNAVEAWKLSHGNDGTFTAGEREQLLADRLVVMHKDTEEKTQTAAPVRGPLNHILYGPPGTGKTSRSVAEAAAIIDGRVVLELMATPAYGEAKKRFDTCRTKFVTFHPSYTYQDFVVGIRPSTAGTNVVYSVEPGPLKRLADLAEENWRASQLAAGNALTDMQRFDRAFAALLKDISNAPEQYVEMTLHGGKKTQVRAGKQAKGVILSREEGSIPYNVTRKGLAALWPQRATFKAPGDMEVCTYNLSDFFAVLKYLETIDSKLGTPEACAPEPLKNCVLVIDEINRGNIAKIFGELMPDVSVRPTVAIDGVELPKLVEKLNQRIAYLFDRDHMLGHAYFMGIKTFADLEQCLLGKVIPLLQEHFFEDWSKVGLVFGYGKKTDIAPVISKKSLDATALFGSDVEVGDGGATFAVANKLTPDMVKAIYE